MDVIYVLFLLYLQLKSSVLRVVFVFNTSLNDATPRNPIEVPVNNLDVKKTYELEHHKSTS